MAASKLLVQARLAPIYVINTKSNSKPDSSLQSILSSGSGSTISATCYYHQTGLYHSQSSQFSMASSAKIVYTRQPIDGLCDSTVILSTTRSVLKTRSCSELSSCRLGSQRRGRDTGWTRQSRDVNNSSNSGSGDAGAAIKAEIAEWMTKDKANIKSAPCLPRSTRGCSTQGGKRC
jgi:hypothetical protein